MTPDASAPRPADPGALFIEFRERVEAGEEMEIEAFCREHPDAAPTLRKLHGEWLELCRLIDEITPTPSVSKTLRDSLGDALDSGAAPPADPEEAARIERLLARLGGSGVAPGRYALRGPLGQGGMGVVFKVWDRDMRRSLAMKLILARGEETISHGTPRIDENRIRRFLEEARITGQLDHPGVVPVHEIGVSDSGRLYFTMREVRGETLARIIERSLFGDSEWSQQRVLGMLLRACEAVAYAHARGVIHRDLKPENIMVGPFGQAYVMDWGLAKVIARPEADESAQSVPSEDPGGEAELASLSPEEPRLTKDGHILGTPPSMSPEQARGDVAAVGERTDVYAMGAVLYQILTGHPPYQRPGTALSKYALLERVRRGPPEKLEVLRPETPAELVAICEKAMARDPAGRSAGMAEMADDLRAYLEGRVVKAHRVGPVVELRKWIGRNRATAAALLAALVMALGGLALTNYVSYSKQRQITASRNELAKKNEALDRSAHDILRLADQRRAEEHLAQARDDLWPRRPGKVEMMSRWLEGARALVGRIDQHQAFLHQVNAAPADAVLAEVMGGQVEKEWLRTQLADLLADLERLRDRVIPDVEQRLAMATTIEEETVDNHADEWAEA